MIQRMQLKGVMHSSQVVTFSGTTTNGFSITSISRNVVEIFGYHAEDFPYESKFWFEHIHPNDVDLFHDALEKIVEHAAQFSVAEIRLLHRNGEYVWIYIELGCTEEFGSTSEVSGTLFSIDKWKKNTLQLEAKIREAEIKNTALDIACKSADIFTLFRDILGPIVELIGFRSGGIYRVDYDFRVARLVAQAGLDPDFYREVEEVRIDKYPYQRVLVEGESILSSDYAEYNSEISKRFQSFSVAILPIYSNGRIYGSLNLMCPKSSVITEQQFHELKGISKLVGRIIESFELKVSLYESMMDFERFFQNIDDFLFILDECGGIIRVNTSSVNRLGYSEQEFQKLNVLDIHPRDKKEQAAKIVTAMINGECEHCQIPLVSKAGVLIPVETKVAKGTWAGRNVLFGISRDVSAQRKAEAELSASENRYRSVVEDQTELICRFTSDGVITFANNAYCRYFSKDRTELVGKSFFPAIPEKDKRFVLENIRKLSLEQPVLTYQHRVVLMDGTVRWQEWTDRAIFDDTGSIVEYQAVGRDISSQKETEVYQQQCKRVTEELLLLRNQQICEIETRYRIIFDSIQDPVLVVNSKSYEVMDANQAAMKYWRETQDQIVGTNFLALTDISKDKLYAVVHQPNGFLKNNNEIDCIAYNGTQGRLNTQFGHLTYNEQPCVVCVARDITQHIEDQRQLTEFRLKLEAIINSLPDATCVIDLNKIVIAWNKKMAEHSGIDAQAVIGRNMLEVFDAQDASSLYFCIFAMIDAIPIENSDRIQVIYRSEADIICEVQTEDQFYSISASLLYDAAGNVTGVIETIRDVTEHKKRTARSLLAQKLESIGILAAGIAHEINTPLQYIGDNTRFLGEAFKSLSDQLTQPSEHSPTAINETNYYLQEIPLSISETLIGVERVNKLMSAMKSFCHPGAGTKEMSDMNQAIRHCMIISHNVWKDIADVDLKLDPKLPLVLCAIDEISQVILNLIINATDAVAENVKKGNIQRGQIIISSASVSNRQVQLSIQDNGVGIAPNLLDKIFDPFFTTKEVGKGTGQGLAIVHDVIRSHNGEINVESKPFISTQFYIKLPIGL